MLPSKPASVPPVRHTRRSSPFHALFNVVHQRVVEHQRARGESFVRGMIEIGFQSVEVVEVEQRHELEVRVHRLLVTASERHTSSDACAANGRNRLDRRAECIGKSLALPGSHVDARPQEYNVCDHAATVCADQADDGARVLAAPAAESRAPRDVVEALGPFLHADAVHVGFRPEAAPAVGRSFVDSAEPFLSKPRGARQSRGGRLPGSGRMGAAPHF